MDHLSRYLQWITVQKGLAKETIESYGRTLRRLEAWSTVPIYRIGHGDLDSFVSELGGASSTVAVRMAALKSFYRYLVRIDVRPDDPAARLEPPKRHKHLPRPIEDTESVFAALDPITRNIAVFLSETGLRISEAGNVREPVPAPDFLRVRGKGSKDRLVPLSPKARAALDELGGGIPINPRTGKPISARTIQKRFKKAGFTPHRCRHTFGTELGGSGVDLGVIQDLMGHASPVTTRVYTAFDLERLRAGVDQRRAS